MDIFDTPSFTETTEQHCHAHFFRKMFVLTWYTQHKPQSKPINIASYGATQQGMSLRPAGISAGESIGAIQRPFKKSTLQNISISHTSCQTEESHFQ